MTAGFGSRSIVNSKVALAPIALVGLLVTALLAGGMLGAAVTSGKGSFGASGHNAEVAATGSSLEEQALIRFRADERSRAAQVAATGLEEQALIRFRADERASATQAISERSSLEEQALIRFRADQRVSAARASTPHVRDHIGLSERLFPIGPTIN